MSEVRLAAAGGPLTATFVPELNMVCSSLRHEGEELLAQRAGLDGYARKGSTFAIPLLYPWANRLAGWDFEFGGRRVELAAGELLRPDPDTGLPIHGVAPAALAWRIVDRRDDSLEAELAFEEDRLLSVFPFPHRLDLKVSLSAQSLTFRLTVTPTGSDRVPIAFGFHPYFELPDADRGDLLLELPVRRSAILDEHGIPTGRTEALEADELDGPVGGRTFDDSFPELDPEPVFAVSGAGRRVAIEYRRGFPVAQLYVPPDRPFLAIEPMTAPVDSLRSGDGLRSVAPGESFTAEFAVTVAAL